MYESPIEPKKEPTMKEILMTIAKNSSENSKEKKVERKFRVPAKARVNKMKAKQNFATVLVVNENGNIDITKEAIEEQTIMVRGIPRLITGKDVLTYKGKPFIIQPSWSVKPFSKEDEHAKSLKDGSNTAGYRILLARMKAGAILGKKNMKMGAIIAGLAILGIIVFVIVG